MYDQLQDNVLCSVHFCAGNPVVEDNPKDVNASIGGEAFFQSSFKNVTMQCNSTPFRWLINGENVNHYNSLEKYISSTPCREKDTILISDLILRFSNSSDLIWDNSEIAFNLVLYMGVLVNISSTPALLRIQGIYIWTLMLYVHTKCM